MTVMKFPAKSMASFFPFFVRSSEKTGIRLADIAEAKTVSKNTLGMRLAVKKAFAAMPLP